MALPGVIQFFDTKVLTKVFFAFYEHFALFFLPLSFFFWCSDGHSALPGIPPRSLLTLHF